MFSITCTTCQARLKVRDESTVGLILPCPKCGSLVQIVRPAEKAAARPTVAAAVVAPPIVKPPVPPQAPPVAKLVSEAVSPPVSEPLAPQPPTTVQISPGEIASPPFAGEVQAVAATEMAAETAVEAVWRKWLILIGSPLGGLVLMLGLMYALFSSNVPQVLPESTKAAAIADSATRKAAASDSSTEKKSAAAKTISNALDPRWLPSGTRVVLSLAASDVAGQSGVERLTAALGPCWTAAVAPAAEGLGLEFGQISRVTLAATDVQAVTNPLAASACSVIAIQLEHGVEPGRFSETGRPGNLTFRGLAVRKLDNPSWPHPFVVLPESGTVLTGPEELLHELENRSGPQFSSLAIAQLVETARPTAKLIAMIDLDAAREQKIASRAGRLFAVWPAGGRVWEDICAVPGGIGLCVDWTPGIRIDVALACADKAAAEGLDAVLATFLPAAKTAVAERIKNLPKDIQTGRVDRRWADRYEVFLQHLLAAGRTARRDLVEDVAWIRAGSDGDPVSTALAVLDAVEPAAADWHGAGLARDREKQKVILDALSEYDRREGGYPPGAAGGALLPPETRLSWLAGMLPHLEQRDLHRRLQFGYSWNSNENAPVTKQTLGAVVNPTLGASATDDGYPVTHYVGVAGIGADAGRLSRSDPKAGVFGFSRSVSPQDIPDGAADTIAILGVSGRLGPWSSGGNATVRGLSEQPYVNGPDGFGSGQPQGMLAGMADGSARFISKDIDPQVLERMVAIQDGAAGESAAAAIARPETAAKPATQTPADATPNAQTLPLDMSNRLSERLQKVEFVDVPLADVVEFVAAMTSLKIEFDDAALARKKFDINVLVTVQLAEADAKQVLETALSPHGLTCVFREGRLLITVGR